MDDLVVWLQAQLDEDERIAKAATDAWVEKRPRAGQPYDIDGVPVRRHIARHDPARVLREVEAKRRMLDEHLGYYGDGSDADWPVRVPTWLALPYADRPGYREEWRP